MPDRVELAVDLEAVSHRYGDAVALDGITLQVPAGSAVALVGPDGVGKSTLLALTAGVRRLQSGRLAVLGGDMRSQRHRDRVSSRVAYMPQGLGRNLYPSLSVYENIDFFARLFGQGGAEREVRIERLLRATGLEPFPDRPAGKLSGGMKQKLALCCALIHDPDLLILDEPTTGVDPLSRRQFWTLFEQIRAERPGLTVLVATAYMDEAERFAELVAVDRGRILAAGPTPDILARTGSATLEDAYGRLQTGPGTVGSEPLLIPPRIERPGPPAIVAEGLTLRFGSFVAVDHVSFRIEQGEIFGFLGSNGCGKTTTMKMLTGLLAADEGRAQLLGQPVEARDLGIRMRVGYMSQGFSLYEELSVRANLDLHARLYRLSGAEAQRRIDEALERFDLAQVADAMPPGLPLGVRQRLQLAVACLHRPEVLILDEPTSGVDPAARTLFWRLLGELSRRDGVTIFVSTHFMNEAELCDRVSLMHAGQVLAVGAPAALCTEHGLTSLEDVFVALLEQASGQSPAPADAGAMQQSITQPAPAPSRSGLSTSWRRIWAFARREAIEVARDRVRLAFALLGPLVLVVTFGFGITFDVEDLPFAVLDRDQSLDSRQFVEGLASSRYFRERPPLRDERDIDRRLQSGELRLAVDIPPGFGRDLLRGWRPEIGVFLDAAQPFRAETARGYVQGLVQAYAQDLARREQGAVPAIVPLQIETRYRYNQDFRSVFAILPGVIMVLTLFFPAMLATLAVVREREVGSISNLYASPTSLGEFLVGKQAPYLVLGMMSFLSMVAVSTALFGLAIKGSAAALLLGAALTVFAATALGLLVSSLVRTQVAAIIVTAVAVTVPAVNFSGFLYPASAVEGLGRIMGLAFPALWFQNVSLGTFAKARGFDSFHLEYLMLFGFGVIFLSIARLLLKKQEA
jgi:ribosome-dependent ATPase